MDRTVLLKRSAAYAAAWIASTVVGLGLVAFATLRWLDIAYVGYVGGEPLAAVLRTAAPGVVVALLGLLVWQTGTTAARYHTLAAAISDETAATFDTESLKSDILAVLDERLAEMHEDVGRTRRLLERQGSEAAADEFEFSEG